MMTNLPESRIQVCFGANKRRNEGGGMVKVVVVEMAKMVALLAMFRCRFKGEWV